MEELNLTTCVQNTQYKIERVAIDDPKICRRIYELGLFENQKIKVIKKSIFKKVILVELGNLKLAIRSIFAEKIYLKRV